MSRTGVGLPSYANLAVWTSSRMTADPYKVVNVTDLVRPSKPGRATFAGTETSSFALPAAVPIQLVALIGHNIPAGVNIRLSLWSDLSNGAFAGSPGTNVYDSGTVATWPSGGPVAGFASIRPFLLNAPAMVRSGRMQINAFAEKVQVGAIEIAGFWEWSGMPYGRGISVDSRDGSDNLLGGGQRSSSGGRVRKVTGEIPFMAVTEAATQGIDFQRITDIQQPFVWGEDFDDPTTWARKCMLARNIGLPPFVGVLHNRDKFPFQLTEHRR